MVDLRLLTVKFGALLILNACAFSAGKNIRILMQENQEMRKNITLGSRRVDRILTKIQAGFIDNLDFKI